MLKRFALASLLFVACSTAFADDDDDEKECSKATLNGNYGFLMDGTIQPFGPVVLSGIIKSNGRGAFSGVETASVGGQIYQATFTGSYTVNAVCSGSAQYQLVAPNLVMSRSVAFVITKGGAEFFIMSTVPGSIVGGKAQRQ